MGDKTNKAVVDIGVDLSRFRWAEDAIYEVKWVDSFGFFGWVEQSDAEGFEPWLAWDKLNTMPTFGDCELAWTNIPRNSVKKYTVEYNGLIGKEHDRKHPTQKPVKLFARILADYSSNLILDPFLGSGTTAYCAKKLNRYCIGIEIEEKYCEIAAKRCCQSVMELSC